MNKDERKETRKIFRQKRIVHFHSKLEQMKIAENNKEAKNFYQEVKNIRKGFNHKHF